MTIEEYLKLAREIAPGRKLFVLMSAGERYGHPFSIHVYNESGYECIAGANSAEASLLELQKWLNAQLTPEEARQKRIEALRDELARLEGD